MDLGIQHDPSDQVNRLTLVYPEAGILDLMYVSRCMTYITNLLEDREALFHPDNLRIPANSDEVQIEQVSGGSDTKYHLKKVF